MVAELFGVCFIPLLVPSESSICGHVVGHVWVELVRQVAFMLRIVPQVKGQFGASKFIDPRVLGGDLCFAAGLNEQILRRGLAVAPLDAVSDLLASPCLLGCSSCFVSFWRKLFHGFVVYGVRYRGVVFRLPMPFQLFGGGVIYF